MSLLTKSTYCFHCQKAGFPSALWEATGTNMSHCVIVCPNCAASKRQERIGTIVTCQYFRPDGTPVPTTLDRSYS